MATNISRISGSFRDPNCHVYQSNERIFRGIKGKEAKFIRTFLESPFFKQHARSKIINSWFVKSQELRTVGLDDSTINYYDVWVEHQKLSFVSYPYEWSFRQLQKAALFHLELHMDALEAGYQLRDASGFNIQFIGTEPIFIDVPSFTDYQEGEPWVAYKQFCEMFLAPLAIYSYTGIETQRWFKSNLDGISLRDCSKILPWTSYFNLNILGHIHAQALAARKISSTSKAVSGKSLSIKKNSLVALLQSMAKTISSLGNTQQSYWEDYENNTSYSDDLILEKEEIVRQFAQNFKNKRILDVGCNAGKFSEIAIESGVSDVIGLDIDGGALDKAIEKPRLKGKQFFPLLYDFTNPSPALGWSLAEREPLSERLPPCDGVICLAFIHHLVIGKNIPLESFVQLLLSLAPAGLVEFPTKQDPMVEGLLANREDIFDEYQPDTFETILKKYADVEKLDSKNQTRHFFCFERS